MRSGAARRSIGPGPWATPTSPKSSNARCERDGSTDAKIGRHKGRPLPGGGTRRAARSWLSVGRRVLPQPGGELKRRLVQASLALGDGHQPFCYVQPSGIDAKSVDIQKHFHCNIGCPLVAVQKWLVLGYADCQ